MVAKLSLQFLSNQLSYLLAKIHMVAKLNSYLLIEYGGYLLAKIHMVAKRVNITVYL